jgi:hypothetical protein
MTPIKNIYNSLVFYNRFTRSGSVRDILVGHCASYKLTTSRYQIAGAQAKSLVHREPILRMQSLMRMVARFYKGVSERPTCGVIFATIFHLCLSGLRQRRTVANSSRTFSVAVRAKSIFRLMLIS